MKANTMKPNRSNLSVPGHVEKMHKKAVSCSADVVMLDLEDSVPPGKKNEAWKTVVQSLLKMNWEQKNNLNRP